MTMSNLRFTTLANLDYRAAIRLQERLVALKQQNSLSDILLFVEHPHVYTLGRGGDESNVLVRRKFRSIAPAAAVM